MKQRNCLLRLFDEIRFRMFSRNQEKNGQGNRPQVINQTSVQKINIGEDEIKEQAIIQGMKIGPITTQKPSQLRLQLKKNSNKTFDKQACIQFLNKLDGLTLQQSFLNPFDECSIIVKKLFYITKTVPELISQWPIYCQQFMGSCEQQKSVEKTSIHQELACRLVRTMIQLGRNFYLFDLKSETVSKYLQDLIQKFPQNSKLTQLLHTCNTIHAKNDQGNPKIIIQSHKSFLEMKTDNLALDKLYLSYFDQHLKETINSNYFETHQNQIQLQNYVVRLMQIEQNVYKQIQQNNTEDNQNFLLFDDFFKSKMTYLMISHLLDNIGIQRKQTQTFQLNQKNYFLKWSLENYPHLLQPNFNSQYQPSIYQLRREFVMFWKDQKECQICLNSFPSKELFITFECHHKYCHACLSGHVSQKLEAFADIYCPDQNCKKTIDKRSPFYQSLSPQEKRKHEKIQKLHFVNSDPFLKLCPMEGCEGFMPFIKGQTLACSACGLIFCQKCLNPIHDGDCEANEVEILQTNLKYKRCKQCRHVVQRISGCNRMTCVCRYQFCYICGQKWTNNHYGCLPGKRNTALQRQEPREIQPHQESQIYRRQRQHELQIKRDVQNRRYMRRQYGITDNYTIQQVMQMSEDVFYRDLDNLHILDQDTELAIEISMLEWKDRGIEMQGRFKRNGMMSHFEPQDSDDGGFEGTRRE